MAFKKRDLVNWRGNRARVEKVHRDGRYSISVKVFEGDQYVVVGHTAYAPDLTLTYPNCCPASMFFSLDDPKGDLEWSRSGIHKIIHKPT